MTSTPVVTRRTLVQVAGAIGAGYGVSVLLRNLVPLGQDVAGNAIAQSVLSDKNAPREGPEDADVIMAVFTDYQCPACKSAAPEMLSAMQEDGKVAVIYKDWPILGPASQQAARYALAAQRQSIYPQVHHALMREPRKLEPDVLRETIASVGGNWDLLLSDLSRFSREIDVMIAQTSREAFGLGINGTPAFLIGSTLVKGALGESEFLRSFRSARKAQSAD